MNLQSLEGNLAFDSEVGLLLPTYCEAANVERLIDEIEGLGLDLSILVIDDSSPDGTASIVRGLQRKYDNILVLVRAQKTGLGTAITDAFKVFLSLNTPPKYVITMDADYSHNPKDIPGLLYNMRYGYDLVIGSRYCRGGRTSGWSFARKLISKCANMMTLILIRTPIRDCTSGFRCYSTSFVRKVINDLHSQTYEIQIETVKQASAGKFRIKEHPILFTNRKVGKSKLTTVEIRGFSSYIVKAIWKSFRRRH